MIVALSGYAQSGKDTFANFLVKDHGFERMAFADPLREMLYALNPTVLHKTGPSVLDFEWTTVQLIVDRFGWEYAKAHSDVRGLLQRLGTEAGRKVLGDTIWVDTLVSKLRVADSRRIVITDCRFLNEAEAVRDMGGLVVRIRRPGRSAVNAHLSETALDPYRFDYTIENAGTLDLLRQAATALVDQEFAAW